MADNELIDITDLIVPDDDIPYFSNEDALDCYETCLHLMDELLTSDPTLIAEPDFDEQFDDNIYEIMHAHFSEDIFFTDEAEEELNEIIEHAKETFFETIVCPRSYPTTFIRNDNLDYEFINQQLDILRNKPQPAQRTKEWYEFRHQLITASNAYKAFESPASQNQLIYEKCQPLSDGQQDSDFATTMVNTNTTLHWGQKYEPLSVQLYEDKFHTRIEDFGCIQHEQYSFLGASPDGINVDPSSKRYGRMLEIKNIVNRDIDGIPKKAYWIQMQLQMEVCNLDECDFLETRFIEYENLEAYLEDTAEWCIGDNACVCKDGKQKGEILYFHNVAEGKPFYVYKPLHIIRLEEIDAWRNTCLEQYEKQYTFIKPLYWKLDYLSCVLVCRNQRWFQSNVGTLADIWAIIEKERVSGCEHRAPKSRMPKMDETAGFSGPIVVSKCLLTFPKQQQPPQQQPPQFTVELQTPKPQQPKPQQQLVGANKCLLQFNKSTGKLTVVKTP